MNNIVETFDSFKEIEYIVTTGIFGIIWCCVD